MNGCAPTCNFTMPGGNYSSELIVCWVSPGIGSNFEIQLRGQWLPIIGLAFQPPAIASVSRTSFPITGGPIVIAGSSFGPSLACGGSVTVGITVPPTQHLSFDPTFVDGAVLPVGFPRLAVTNVTCDVTSWTATSINCTVPVGLDTSAAVTVSVGGQSATLTNAISFASPTISSIQNGVDVPTSGNTYFTVVGTSLPVPGLGYDVAVMAGRTLCACFPATMTSTSLTCVTPPGAGTVPVTVFTPEQHSEPVSAAVLTYAKPQLSAVSPPAAASARTVDGGFVVTASGANFLPGNTFVTIASSTSCSDGLPLACANVTVDEVSFAALTCIAPPGCGRGVLSLTVVGSVDGVNSSVQVPFVYDAPVVTAVYNQTTDATLTTPALIVGANFGARGHALPSISIGSMLCIDVKRVNSSVLTCSMPPTVVGRYVVSVQFAGVVSRVTAEVDRMCGAGFYGLPGQSCQVCPAVRPYGGISVWVKIIWR